MSKTHSYAEIASSFQLWQEFVDPNGATTRHEFDSMTTADRIAAQIEAFGPEPEAVPNVDHVLANCRESNGFYSWDVEGGRILLTEEQLRPALEEAYEEGMPGWTAFVNIDYLP